MYILFPFFKDNLQSIIVNYYIKTNVFSFEFSFNFLSYINKLFSIFNFAESKNKQGGNAGGESKAAAGQANTAGNLLIAQSTQKISQVYEIDKSASAKLGEGSYGSVSRCKNKKTGEIRACKMIPKAKVKNMARFKQEITIMKMLDHPNLVKLYF